MNELKTLWKQTKSFVEKEEQKIVDAFISFLREVAKEYLKRGRRVAFNENKVVHYGEGGFGSLVIEGNEDVSEVFGDYILEINFEPKIDDRLQQGYIKIKKDNISDIKYHL